MTSQTYNGLVVGDKVKFRNSEGKEIFSITEIVTKNLVRTDRHGNDNFPAAGLEKVE